MSVDQGRIATNIDDEIMFVVGTLQVGGSERHVSSVARALRKRGHRVSIYCLSGSGPLRPELEAGDVRVLLPPVDRQGISASFPLRILRLSLAAAHLLTVMVRRRPAIVHFFLPEAYLIGAPLAALARRPLRVMSRRSLNVYQTRRPLLGKIERRLHQLMTAILGNSASVVRDLKREGIATERLGLIYNGIDVARLKPANSSSLVRASLGLTPTTLTMVIVANLIPYKGHLDLLRALGGVQEDLPPEWRLLVVGRDDGIEASLRKEAVSLGIAPNVSFLGSRYDIPDLLGAGDIGILCSHEEGFSNSVLEGMAAGLPMIVTNVGGNAEAVIDGACGLVVPSRDPVRLGEAIVTMARNPELRAKFGAAARVRIESQFTMAKCVESYENLYRGLQAGKLPKDIADVRLGGR